MEELQQNISKSLFGGLCWIVGSSQIIAMRRDVADIHEAVVKKVDACDESIKRMQSGSLREGFRLEGTDFDTMFWFEDRRVIWDFSQITSYNLCRKGIILADCSKSLPGYALLQLITARNNTDILQACVIMSGEVYISSSIYRQMSCSLRPNSTLHGPCVSGSFGPLEYDHAFCFSSDFWPPVAAAWINRCHTWPLSDVVHDIVRKGCHFVAIGQKLGNHEAVEWRISFSLAERKIVYSMNQCQFLTYGLLKLFLKEVINKGLNEDDKLLSSYHMKTAVFWVIQQNTMACWCPQNLLECFEVCLKCILKWVYDGVCPNFFIPENNMFLNRIYGRVQERLFHKLYNLYQRRLESILFIPSISSYIKLVLKTDPLLFICTDEQVLSSETEFDVELFSEIHNRNVSIISNVSECIKYLDTIKQFLDLPLSPYHVAMLQKLSASNLLKTAFLFQYREKGKNKRFHTVDKFACHMLQLAAKFGFVSDSLYFAMYYYKTHRVVKALSILSKIGAKFAKQSLMYNRQVDPDLYLEGVGGKSWSKKTRESAARDVKLDNKIFYFNELLPEQLSGQQDQRPFVQISPFVLFYMLEILCYRQVGSRMADEVLCKLQSLVHDDKNYKVPSATKDISFQILGICQQVTGNIEDAFYSYQESLTHFPFNGLKSATFIRICSVIYTLLEKRNSCNSDI